MHKYLDCITSIALRRLRQRRGTHCDGAIGALLCDPSSIYIVLSEPLYYRYNRYFAWDLLGLSIMWKPSTYEEAKIIWQSLKTENIVWQCLLF